MVDSVRGEDGSKWSRTFCSNEWNGPPGAIVQNETTKAVPDARHVREKLDKQVVGTNDGVGRHFTFKEFRVLVFIERKWFLRTRED
ncbi:hypothetical protein JTE90_021545 [Oedothorax gibbosus]|uniref:Uncharacterized protein n=1 Tax=Oedothorax gibbosus TaxID=931172 RepID=A0AAV6VQG9_9ARAC|nr:hypothetical protein JTE90_021545 [Oedothorax gibbosus]